MLEPANVKMAVNCGVFDDLTWCHSFSYVLNSRYSFSLAFCVSSWRLGGPREKEERYDSQFWGAKMWARASEEDKSRKHYD